MTPQEAKKELMHINLILAHQMDLARAEKEKDMLNRNYQANNIAISALEKQMPKKPRKVVRTSCNSKTISEITEFNFYNPAVKKEVPEYKEYKYDDYICPVCNALTKDGTPKYCWRCGQALDWGD